MFREDSWRGWRPHPIGVSAVTHSTLSDFVHVVRLGSRVLGGAPARVPVANRFPPVPHYPSDVRAVTASLRDAAGGWPAALWLALAAAVAIGGAGGASSGGIALAAAACLGACALAGVAAAGGLRPWAPPPRRVIVYVAALAAVGARLVRLDRLVADAAGVLRRRRPLARGRGRGGRRRTARRPAAPPARGRRVGALRRLAAARSPTPSSSARTASSSRPRRGCRACSAIPTRSAPTRRSRRPAALWLASAPQRARRVAGCGTLALLVLGLALASSRGGMLAAVIGCGVWLAVSERRTESGAALLAVLAVSAPGRPLGARPALLQGARRALHRARRLAPGLVLARRPCWRPRVLGPLAVELAQRAGQRVRRVCGWRCWPSPSSALCSRPCGCRRSTAARAARSATSGTSSRAAARSAPPITSRTLSTNLRGRWWGEAWDGFTAHPLQGNGADTFETIDRLARPDFQQAGQEHSRFLHVLSGSGCWARSRRPIALGRRRRLRGRRHAPARQRALRRARARWPASARSRCTTRSTGSGSRRALTLLAYPIPVLIACAAGGGAAVARRAPRRGPRRAGGDGASRSPSIPATLPVLSNRALDARRPAREPGPRSTRRASRPTSPPRSTARRSTPNSSAPACCRRSAGRADARRAVDHALSLAPKDDRRSG